MLGISWRMFRLGVLPWLGLTPGTLTGQTPEPERTFSLDSRYLLNTYSNQAVAQFGIDMMSLTTLTTSLIEPSSKLRNAGQGLLLLVTSTVVGQAFTLAYHEYGHGTRAAAAGMKPRYGFGGVFTPADISAALNSPDSHESFFGYYLGSFVHHSGYALATPDNALFPPLTEDELVETGWHVLLSAGGLNNDMLYAEEIEDELYRNGGHIGFFTSYFNSKLAASQYSVGGEFNDVANTVARYRDQGFDVDEDQIDSASRTSLFLSATSYQLVYQTVRMFMGSSFRFEPWKLRGVELPRTSFFMTRSGLSYRVRSGYQTGAWRFSVAVERVFEGDERTEVSLGVERRTTLLGLAVEATLGEQIELGLEGSYRLNDRLIVSGGYALYDSRNLRGERLIPSLESGARYHDLYVKMSLVY